MKLLIETNANQKYLSKYSKGNLESGIVLSKTQWEVTRKNKTTRSTLSINGY